MDDSNAEKKVQQELFVLVVDANNDFDTVLKKFSLCKAIRLPPFQVDNRISCDQRNSATRNVLGHLLKSRTEGNTLFDVIGVDFAGHMKHGGKCKKEEKA